MVIRIGQTTPNTGIKEPKLPSKKSLTDAWTRINSMGGMIIWHPGKPREILMGPVVVQKPAKPRPGVAWCGGTVTEAWVPRDDPKKVYFHQRISGGLGGPPGTGKWAGPFDIKGEAYPPGARYGVVSRRNLVS